MADHILAQNRASWNSISDEFHGTLLPVWGCSSPTEDELYLLPDLRDKKVLEIGCGSGHSLKWCGEHGASELWGLDISDRQLENAGRLLRGEGYEPKLFRSPMEQNPGLPLGYFDVVYSVYAIGWTTDLQTTFDLAASYLKPGGIYVFSWDHPFLHCVEAEVSGQTGLNGRGDHAFQNYAQAEEGRLLFSGSYHEPEPFTFQKLGQPMTLFNRRLSDYINALAIAGFAVERVVEETDSKTLARDCAFSSEYYAPCKAKRFPLSIIIKARKL